jgi:hypothetical protein
VREDSGDADRDVELRRQQAADYDQTYARLQGQRETQVQAALVSGATFLTLMSASAMGRVEPAERDHLLAAQFLLCLLFGGAFAFYLNTLYHHALRIADNAARRLELEEQGGITLTELPDYLHGPRTWRKRSNRGARLLAFIPRYGQSQREAALFAPVVAVLPAAWFSLTRGASGLEDAVVIAITVGLGALVVRHFFAGCRHWVWVHPKTLDRTRSAFTDPAGTWGWWRELQTEDRDPQPSEVEATEGRESGGGGEGAHDVTGAIPPPHKPSR